VMLILFPGAFTSLTSGGLVEGNATYENNNRDAGMKALMWIGTVLCFLGMLITAVAEIQRMNFKNNPENKGKIMTTGLWYYAMHINYTGEFICYSGWALLTLHWYNAWLPVFMLVMFVEHHIPGLHEYLATRYGRDFEEYKSKTKKMFPGIW